MTLKHQSMVYLAALMFAFTLPASAQQMEELPIGAEGPMFDYEMTNIDGTLITLDDVKGENGTLLIFSCNTCPFVHAWEDRYLQIEQLAAANNIGMIYVNPNEDIRDQGESLIDNQERAMMIGYTAPYTIDKDHQLADAYGATRTPHVYLMNNENILVFRGAIDDNSRSAEEVESTYLHDAILELAAGETISTPTSRALGCTIKRK
ncbi:MAG: Peroxiredoxin [Bacteroidetes bacterium HLUCCA01]|nr:MAG: Peroxiredoxin [Bacteroidetes bacterium HLUCCA01]